VATAAGKRPNEVNRVPFNFLSGGGEMGELIRSIDWTKTPIGPVSKWSPALRTMVGLLLRNRFPLLLWWGPQFVQIYNDAYRPIPGDKHPKSMGQPASECWAEIWHIIGPMIEAPFSGKEATTSDDLFLLINRKGFVEETHFKVAYSPVPDDTVQPTGIGGVLGTVAEITQQIIGERQLKTLRELGARAIDAKTPQQACETAVETLTDNSWDVPFALFYLLDETGTQAKLVASCGFKTNGQANPAYLDIKNQGDSQAWNLKSVIEQRKIEVYSNLSPRLGQLPSGHWSEAPNTAIAIPLAAPDQPFPYGVMIAGISPHREFDESYRSFFELGSSQVTTAIRNALAYQEERKRAENLAELDKAKTVFFSNVSHEFRTPLTLMMGPLEDMLSQPKSAIDPANREQITLIHRNSQRLLKLVNSLLDFSRIEAGRIQASYVPVDLSVLTTDLVSVFRSAIEKAGLKLTVDCPELPEPIYVDKDMWEKIVLNLVSNAFKFTFEGEIAVTLRWCGDHVELDVKDTGTGIAPKEMPRLFERFHRIRGAKGRSQEGTGIGLALVQELAKLHGGNVQASSTLGEGTTFTVSIPTGCAHLPKEHVGAAKTLQSSATGAAPYVEEALGWLPQDTSPKRQYSIGKELHLPQRKKLEKRAKILLADDNADMRDYVTRLLSYYFDVVAFADGKAALEAATKDLPDLVLTDIMMPGLDGFELLRELRASPITKSIPVIFLSARAGEESRIEGLQAGADDYLVKPFSSRELIAKVDARLEIARLQAEAGEALRKSAAELAKAQEIARTGSFTIDVQNNELSWSDECYRIFGINKEKTKLTRALFLSLIAPDEMKAVDQAVQESIRTEQPYSIEYTVNRQDGASLIIHSEGQVVKDKNGKVIKVYGINQDITERKKAEEALREIRAKLQVAFERLTEAIFIADAEGNIVDFNDEFVRYHRFKDKEECSRNIADCPKYLDVWLSDSTPAPVEQWAMARALRGEIGSNVEYRLRRKETGETWWGSYNFSPIKGQGGKIVGAVVAGRDITEQKKAEEALKESEQLYRAVFDNSEDAFELIELIYDKDGKPVDQRYLKINRAFKTQTGIKEDDLTSKTAKQLLPNVEPYWFEIPDKVLKTGKTMHTESYNQDTKRY
jgi:PAS domain S-box-containing protein